MSVDYDEYANMERSIYIAAAADVVIVVVVVIAVVEDSYFPALIFGRRALCTRRFRPRNGPIRLDSASDSEGGFVTIDTCRL